MNERILHASDKQIVIYALNELVYHGYRNYRLTGRRPSEQATKFLRRAMQIVLILQGRAEEVAQVPPPGDAPHEEEP